MSHVRPDAKIPRHRLAACKKGKHSYGMAHEMGAGIERRVCRTCGAVTIDLTAVDDSHSSADTRPGTSRTDSSTENP